LNNVIDGQYTLTAVATDNDGAAPLPGHEHHGHDTNSPVLLSAIASPGKVS